MLPIALAVSTLSTQLPLTVPRCQSAGNTLADDECLGHERDKARRRLERYRVRARAKLLREYPETGALAAAFDAAQSAWLAYQKQQCDAVYTRWQGGTFRVAMSLSCEIRTAHLRTDELWLDWLTYPNSTAADLPEPVVERGS